MADADHTLGRHKRQCAACGTTFNFGAGRGQARMYCGLACLPPRKAPTKPCDFEGCARVARTDSASYCEAHYYQGRRGLELRPIYEKVAVLSKAPADRPVVANCLYCGNAKSGYGRFCSLACDARFRRGNPLHKACDVCGQYFDPRSAHGRDASVCSEACRKARQLECNRRFYERAIKTDRGKARIRRAEYKRKARKRDAFVEVVERDEVMERGKWKCHLCGDPIPRRAKWPDPLFGTVDHVLPLAAGGKHSYANVKPAHLRCNCQKGAKPIGQLGLPLAA